MKKFCLCTLLFVSIFIVLSSSSYALEAGASLPAGNGISFVNDRRDVNNPEKAQKIQDYVDGSDWWIYNYGKEVTEVPAPSRQKLKIRTSWAIVRKFYGEAPGKDERMTADIQTLLKKGVPLEKAEQIYSIEYTYKYDKGNRIYHIAETIYLDSYGNEILYETDEKTPHNVKDSFLATYALKFASKAEDCDIPVFIRDKTTGGGGGDGDPEHVLPLHPKANCQVTNWDFNEDKKTVTLTIKFKGGKTRKAVAKFATNKEDRFFKVFNLPAGLQVIMPDDDEGIWVVNVDARSGYVTKIDDVDDIAHSKLNPSANRDSYGGKTFESGEGFIILKSSGMTIRPPVY